MINEFSTFYCGIKVTSWLVSGSNRKPHSSAPASIFQVGSFQQSKCLSKCHFSSFFYQKKKRDTAPLRETVMATIKHFESQRLCHTILLNDVAM